MQRPRYSMNCPKRYGEISPVFFRTSTLIEATSCALALHKAKKKARHRMGANKHTRFIGVLVTEIADWRANPAGSLRSPPVC